MAFTASNLVGNRESRDDKQIIVSPEETPMLALVEEITPTNDVHTYTFDKLKDPTPTALIEGTDTTVYADKFKDRKDMSVRLQEFEETFGITSRQETNDPAAIVNQLATAEMRATEDLQRQVEVVIGSDQATAAASGSFGDLSAGQGWFMDASNSAIDALYRATSGSVDTTATASVTADTINNVLQAVCENGGKAGSYVLLANSALFRAVNKAYLNSSVHGRVTFFEDNTQKITLKVKTVSTEFGDLDVVYAPFLGAASDITTAGTGWSLGNAQKARGYLVRKGTLAMAFKSKNKVAYHEDKGAGKRGNVRSIGGFLNYAPRANGAFKATS